MWPTPSLGYCFTQGETIWGKWPGELKLARSLTIAQETVQALVLHAFCDSTGKGAAAAMYAAI